MLRKQEEKESRRKIEGLKELQRKKEEEDLAAFMSTFTKDRQGVITSSGEASLMPILDDTSVSANLFTTDQLAALDLRISESNHETFKAIVDYINASKNTPVDPSTSAVNLNVGPSVPTMNPSLV